MYLVINQLVLLSILLIFSNCKKKNSDNGLFETKYTLSDIQSSAKFSLMNQNIINQNLKEISGLVCGRKNENFIYMLEDKGNVNEIYVFNTSGVLQTKLIIQGMQNIDWEDITIGPGPVDGESYIYIGDIGDNDNVRTSTRIIRFVEPDLSSNTANSISISTFDVINFQYKSGAKDAETLMIHPTTKDLIIMSKSTDLTHVYKLEFPYNKAMNEPVFVGLLPFKKLVAGDVSSDGQRIAVKNKSTIYYWETVDNDIYKTLFHHAPKTVTYTQEPQGESLGFSKDGKSYFTITETKDHAGAQPILFHYMEN